MTDATFKEDATRGRGRQHARDARADDALPSALAFATPTGASVESFLSVSAASRYQVELEGYANSLLQQGHTRPGWCLIGLKDGVPVARAALWAPPGRSVPTDIVMIEADWSEDDLAGGRALMEGLHELASYLGAEVLSHSVDGPPTSPQYQENEEARDRLMTSAGYELLRDGLRWTYAGSSREELPAVTLDFRPLAEVGEEAFVEALAATYTGTGDAWITRTVEEHGTLGAAQADFLDYQSMEHLPEWWELAYAEDGRLVGLVMPARNPSVAVIAYIGIVPEQRGRGLAPHLLRRGTEKLLASGADEIRGDCDRDNIAMAKTFERAGFRHFARRRTYRRALSTAGASS
jgi:RimJ/RimL family protein N-acetyltransferase